MILIGIGLLVITFIFSILLTLAVIVLIYHGIKTHPVFFIPATLVIGMDIAHIGLAWIMIERVLEYVYA